MDISGINSISNVFNNNSVQKVSENSGDNSFASLLKGAISEVNNSQIEGYNAMEGIATGKVANLQQAVQKIEEAELSLKLALEVKNKAMGSFKEIMAMHV